MKVSRAWLQTYFEKELPSAEELAHALMFHSFEVEEVVPMGDDWVIDVDVLPNRSSDCLSHRGIARELATILSIPMKRDSLCDPLPTWHALEHVQVTVDDDALCPRYMMAVVRGITVGESPEWLKKRLEILGQRSINAIVDATNYIMLDIGQPLHVFDLAKIGKNNEGGTHIRVRNAHTGETITSLSGELYTLAERHLLITDDTTNTPLAIAGIKGGKQAEVDSGTTDIIIEAGNFFYQAVRKTSRELKLATDASVRFQNEPSSRLPAFAMRDVILLLSTVAGGTVEGVCDTYVEAGEGTPITVTGSCINQTLGTSLTHDDIERVLVRFEWEFSRSNDTFAVTPPWERTDMHIKEDVIEEIGRVYGYTHIASLLPSARSESPRVNKREWYVEHIRHTLVVRGYSEVYTYTFTDHGEVEVANPLASDKAFLRRDIRGGLMRALEENAHHASYLGLDTVQLFEVGTVFRKQGEVLHLALGARAITGKQKSADTALVRDLAVLAESLGMELTGEVPVDGVVEISIDALLLNLPEKEGYETNIGWNPTARYRPWSPYPCVYRDIAVWVPIETPAEEVLAVIVETAPDILIKHFLFDSFQKEGRISYAWHLVFQSFEKTLTDSEVGVVMDTVTQALGSRKGWEVR